MDRDVLVMRLSCFIGKHLPRNVRRGVLVTVIEDYFPEHPDEVLAMPIDELLTRFEEDARPPELRAGPVRPVPMPLSSPHEVWPIRRADDAADPGA